MSLRDDAPQPATGAAAAAPRKKPPSRDDTWTYLQTLQKHDWSAKIEAATALKQLAFDADAAYKDGLIRGGLLRLLMTMLRSAPDEFRSKAAEQACSCMYSMAPSLSLAPHLTPRPTPSPYPYTKPHPCPDPYFYPWPYP